MFEHWMATTTTTRKTSQGEGRTTTVPTLDRQLPARIRCFLLVAGEGNCRLGKI